MPNSERVQESIWIDAERLGDHVHAKVSTGVQGGQSDMPTYERGSGHFNNAGGAGTLIFRAEQWPAFIRALAMGGAETGLRVMWRLTPDDGRYLWNGLSCDPCIVGTQEPVEWERSA
jgi:hypothetical protein